MKTSDAHANQWAPRHCRLLAAALALSATGACARMVSVELSRGLPPPHEVARGPGAPTAFVEYYGPDGLVRLDVWNDEMQRWDWRAGDPRCAYLPDVDRRLVAVCDFDGSLRAHEIGADDVATEERNAEAAVEGGLVNAILLAREGTVMWALAWHHRRPDHVLLLKVAEGAVFVAASFDVAPPRAGSLRFEVLQQARGGRSLLVRVHGTRDQHWIDEDLVVELGGDSAIRRAESADQWLPEYRNQEDVLGRRPGDWAAEGECLAALRYRSWQDGGGVRVLCITDHRAWWLDSTRSPRGASALLSIVDGVGACELTKGKVTTFYWNDMHQRYIEVGLFDVFVSAGGSGRETTTTVTSSADLVPVFRCGLPRRPR